MQTEVAVTVELRKYFGDRGKQQIAVVNRDPVSTDREPNIYNCHCHTPSN